MAILASFRFRFWRPREVLGIPRDRFRGLGQRLSASVKKSLECQGSDFASGNGVFNVSANGFAMASSPCRRHRGFRDEDLVEGSSRATGYGTVFGARGFWTRFIGL